ncbi:MAG: phosphoglycerate kinase [Acholeplasmataceae bacterium]|nr:phosphoglycerate kinase [Acholeplasmataceae bacterium]
MMKKTIKDLDLKNKRILIRVDFNVPIHGGVITDDNRIVQALPTINYALENGGKVILLSHLGRIKSEEDLAKNSLKPVSVRLQELLGQKVLFVPHTRGKEVEAAVNNLKPGEVLMLENTRFEDLEGKKESKNDPELGKYWASLADVFVNDAFGTAHRAHASNVGIACEVKETVAGFLLEKEIKFIGETVDHPARPFIAILGGAKVSDKIGVIENLLKVADYVLIAGGMAYTFFKAQGYETGTSLVENDKLDLARELLEKGKGKLILGIDVYTSKEFSNDITKNLRLYTNIPKDEMGMDIGPETLKLFNTYLKGAKTVVWNGPVGVFEFENFKLGTVEIAKSLAKLENAVTIIGGGDSAAAVIENNLADGFTHISTGGGASLEYLEGKKLPGIECVCEK